MNDPNHFRKPAARTRAGCFLALFLLTVGATASAQVVTNSADSGPGTLRSAITNAASGAVITFDPSLSGATITLSNTLTINTNLTIDASALSGGLQINGNGSVQIFNVASAITVLLNSLTITNAVSTNSGGGILNDGTLTLTNCILSGNSAHSGGGIDNLRTLTLNQCTLSGNSASDYGGGIYNFLNGTLALNQCTLSGNSAHSGGGISNVGTLTLNQCTLSGNSAIEGGGIDNYYAGRLAMTNTIVAGNIGSPGADIYGYGYPLTYGGSNLVQSVDNSGGYTGPAPLTSAPYLAPLGNYGGPTQTMPPLPGSPAIDAGSNDATNDFATDQRGLPRFVGPQVDIGAVEFQASPVVTNADSGPGSLRYAIAYVTNNATITFDPSLSGATITLSNTLTINTNLTIDASALPDGLQINGNGSVQIFNVASNTFVFLNSLTITNGFTSGGIGYGGGGILNGGTLTLTNCTLSGNSADFGGGILNGGTLTLIQCTVSGNSTGLGYGGSDSGGGIYNGGLLTLSQCTLSGNSANFGGGIDNEDTLTMNQCTLSENYAEFHGGGIYVDSGASLTVNGSTFSGNQADGLGGGLFGSESTLTINNSTFSGNQADNFSGGGICTYSTNTLTINGSTFSANSAGSGGGIAFGEGTLMINNSTFSANSAREVGGIQLYGGVATLTNTIVADTPSITFLGVNNLTNSNPLLAPLGNYGGPTQTMPPLPGSPAIGAGSVAANTFSTDQRGYPRTQNGLIDLGAVELQSPAANPPVLENLTVPAGGGNGLQFTFTNAPAADFTVLTATNVALALTNWTVLGEVQQVAPGQYQFTDPQAATNPARFYRVRSP